ncbi:MAG: UDP-N-acetylglucosamine 2-epimerase (non-hydrolyzing) [Nitrospirae bacterium]|nr:UDP-N-acetylglucosamine 2-epimerase (non-hydrolyzing) [Candidatus Manganitrophaceae bacterium]
MPSTHPRKIMLVFGTRPEAIKLCPLVKALEKHTDEFKTVVCTTAQHRAMLDQVLKTFDVAPNYDLNLMKNDQTLFDITSGILIGIGKIINKENPELILVQGDTTTTFSTSLAAYYNRIKVGHVEAGLRTGNKYSPFPEEINRKMTTILADIHFAPTKKAKENLLREGVLERDVIVTGNTVIDALLWVRKKISDEKKTYKELSDIDFTKKIILVTGHRRENFGQDFVNICQALKELAVQYREIEIVYPVHLNPNVRRPVYAVLSGIENVKLIEPLDYEPFIYLMDRSYFIISDSGGIQEEAPSLGKPVLVTRNTTERPEAVEVGAVKLVGTDRKIILQEAEKLLDDRTSYSKMSTLQNPYGDGRASEIIIGAIRELLHSDGPS